MPWGPNSQLHLVQGCGGAGYFFDIDCVSYPTNYAYPSSYQTRALVNLQPSVGDRPVAIRPEARERVSVWAFLVG